MKHSTVWLAAGCSWCRWLQPLLLAAQPVAQPAAQLGREVECRAGWELNLRAGVATTSAQRTAAGLKDQIGERSDKENFRHQNSVKILPEFEKNL